MSEEQICLLYWKGFDDGYKDVQIVNESIEYLLGYEAGAEERTKANTQRIEVAKYIKDAKTRSDLEKYFVQRQIEDMSINELVNYATEAYFKEISGWTNVKLLTHIKEYYPKLLEGLE